MQNSILFHQLFSNANGQNRDNDNHTNIMFQLANSFHIKKGKKKKACCRRMDLSDFFYFFKYIINV